MIFRLVSLRPSETSRPGNALGFETRRFSPRGSFSLPKCLCLAPTYELALQIGQVIETIGRFCADVRVTYAVRGNRGESFRMPFFTPAG